MRKISAKELKRMQGKGGVKVKRRPGTAPEPEPEIVEEETAPDPMVEIVSLFKTAITDNTKALERIVDNMGSNTALEPESTSILPEFKEPESEVSEPEPEAPKKVVPIGVPVRTLKQNWDYDVDRDEKGRMAEIVAMTESGRKIVYKMIREKDIIQQIEITDGSKKSRLLDVKRSDSGLIEKVA